MKNFSILLFIAVLPLLLHSVMQIVGVEIRLFGRGGFLELSSFIGKNEFGIPTDWQERAYLEANVDVAEAVDRGTFTSGYEHYVKFGKQEGRSLTINEQQPSSSVSSPMGETTANKITNSVPLSPPPTGPALDEHARASMISEVGESNTSATMSIAAERPADLPNDDSGVATGKLQGRYIVQQGGSLATIAGITQVQVTDLMTINPGLPAGWLPMGTIVNLPVPWPEPVQAPDNRTRSGASAPIPGLKPSLSSVERASRVVIKGIRFGLHGDVARLVLDVSAQTPFHVSVRADGRALVIEVPQAAWATGRKGQAPKSSVLSSYAVEGGASTSRLVVSSREAIQLKLAKLFPPHETAGYRIVIDIGRSPGRASAREIIESR